jgi:serine/threonine protein kinase/tetratricopeptide (TPR) repeat protein
MTTCPSPDELDLYAQQKLNEVQASAIESHLQDCLSCQLALSQIKGDPSRKTVDSQLNVTSDWAGPEKVGTIIGPYKLLEKIGEGGFGVVFMAEQQQPVRRKVALKLIKPGMDTRQVIARFEAERQALALMEHPNIARVFDAGESNSGRPYFVMELVKGIPITEFCDEVRLTTRERLELFNEVCGAVQHAHQKGIIHRDLKPSNVLVTLHGDRPVVKVIDFGVAKATGEPLTDKTLFTAFAQWIGTPVYMSPEQAALSGLDIDTRSDVYSLGVMLYELLTGTTPLTVARLRAAAFDEIRRLIREEEPERPSTRISSLGNGATQISSCRQTEPSQLRQLLRSELDWIVLKSLEKDRARRYESPSSLARDIERFLRDEPVEACPPSASYRIQKFLRKHRSAIILASAGALVLFVGSAAAIGVLGPFVTSAVALTLLVGTAFAAWQAIRARSAESAAVAARQNAEKARARTRAALDELTSQAIETWLSQQSRLLPEHMAFLERVAFHYAGFAADSGNDEVSLASIGAANSRLAALYDQLGREQDTRLAAEQAEGQFRALLRLRTGHREYRQGLMLALWQQAGTLLQSLDDTQVDGLELEAIDLAESLAADAPDDYVMHGRLAGLLSHRATRLLGTRQQSRQQLEEARTLLDRAMQAQRRVVDRQPELDDHREMLAIIHETRAVCLQQLDDADGAALERAEAISIHKALYERNRDKRVYRLNAARAGLQSALAGWRSGDFQAVSDEFQWAASVAEDLVRDLPGIFEHQQVLVWIQLHWRRFAFEVGDHVAAEGLAARALHRIENLAVNFSEQKHELQELKAFAKRAVADCHAAAGDLETARREYTLALELLEESDRHSGFAVHNRHDEEWAAMFAGRAHVLDQLNLVAESLADWDRALAAEKKSFRRLAQKARTLVRAGQLAEAEAALRTALSQAQQNEPEQWTTHSLSSQLGDVLLQQEKYDEAAKYLLAGYAGINQRAAQIPWPRQVHLRAAIDPLIRWAKALNRPADVSLWEREFHQVPPSPEWKVALKN